jgi:SAM-dependent methyltransferase
MGHLPKMAASGDAAGRGRSYVHGMTNIASTELQVTQPSAAWMRVMARVYDPFVWLGELAGMRDRRSALLADARGRVFEIGAGTGLNIAHYPVGAPADRLPLADASVDTVVSTLVLCTVDDPERTLGEIARVLRPGGRLLFIEHVRASSRFLAACQDYLFRPWRGFAGGCCCNRRTVELMRACGFAVAADDAVWRGMPAIVHPLVVGRATRG